VAGALSVVSLTLAPLHALVAPSLSPRLQP
jgi:hypothetical protein